MLSLLGRICGLKRENNQRRSRLTTTTGNSSNEGSVSRSPPQAGRQQEGGTMYPGPTTTAFFCVGGQQDRALISEVYRIAQSKGPQPIGYREIIRGVTVEWYKIELELQGLGGPPSSSKGVKPACHTGNNPPVRALYPQIPPPAEPRI